MGNRVMKNEIKSLPRTVERELESDIDVAHQPSNLRVVIETNSIKSEIVVEDATNLTSDSSTVSTTEYESACANDSDMTSLNRLSSCTDISCDIPFETLDITEAVQTTMETVNQVSAECVGSVVFSQEEDIFYSLTDDPPRADDEKPSGVELELNSIGEEPKMEDARTTHQDMYGKIKSYNMEVHQSSSASISEVRQVDDSLSDVISEVSVVLECNHGDAKESLAVELCPRRIIEALNLHARFPAVFDLNTKNIFLRRYDGSIYQLQEELVIEFLANGFAYLDALKVVVFELAGTGYELNYLACVDEELMMTASRPVQLPGKRLGEGDHIAIVKPYQEDLCEDGLCESNAKYVFQSKHETESDDIMNCGENVSEAGPTTAANIDNIPLLNDSCDLEFISKIGGTGLVAENLRKQSLYVKFDPLVASEVNNSSMNGDTTLTNDVCNLTLNDTMVDTNCRRVSDERHNSSAEVTDSNEPVGKLISVTPNRSPRKKKSKFNVANELLDGQSSTPKSSPRFPDTDPDDLNELKSLLLKQMKREEAFKEEIESTRREHEQTLQKLQNVEKEKSQLRNALEAAQENEKKLKNELKERIKSKQQLSMVMEEYEKTISQMVTRRDEEKREFEASVRKIEAERDSAIQHLNNLENAFNDVHQKYERGKLVNEALKKNEDILKKSLTEYEVTVKTVENKYELLKSHATSQLEKANQELELITQTYEKEQAKLKAMLRKSEIQISSLQNSLDQKAKENQELTAVCDELIVKLSTHSNA